MGSVFISYRRQTAAGEARALFNDLVARLGPTAVFMDVDSISLGRDFRNAIQKTLSSCDLVLVLIDQEWAAVKDEKGQIRLEDPGDYVRMEIEAALKRDIAVTPVLVKGAQMPATKDLPVEIRDLAYRHGFELSHGTWDADVREMIRRLNLYQVGSEETVQSGAGKNVGAALHYVIVSSFDGLKYLIIHSAKLIWLCIQTVLYIAAAVLIAGFPAFIAVGLTWIVLTLMLRLFAPH
jgi:hypothetical protein